MEEVEKSKETSSVSQQNNQNEIVNDPLLAEFETYSGYGEESDSGSIHNNLQVDNTETVDYPFVGTLSLTIYQVSTYSIHTI
jgi:hypothetical protein